jgi:hypothetical protein
LGTTVPELHEEILKRLWDDIIADSMLSVLVLPPPPPETVSLEKLKRVLDTIPGKFHEKILIGLLEGNLDSFPPFPWASPTTSFSSPSKPNSTIPKNAKSLKGLPTELRVKIFKLALAEE